MRKRIAGSMPSSGKMFAADLDKGKKRILDLASIAEGKEGAADRRSNAAGSVKSVKKNH